MINSYLNDQKAIDRLVNEYNKHKNLIIGFDFDCTIYDFHKENLEVETIISILKKCSDLGFTMCLYSASLENGEGIRKGWACTNFGIKVDYINSSPILINQDDQWNIKPVFSILLDDRAGLSSAYYILKQTLIKLNLYED